jgi:methylmalonyl-CoA mutase
MTQNAQEPYKPQHKVRIITAASLFDGHDAAINIMRRILQSTGAEVIHLGHNRSAREIVEAALQEDAQAVAITSYQGGHNEFFRYVRDLLNERGGAHVKIFGGGGGTILPEEIEELHRYGINRIYSPEDGRAMGLQGMINDLIEQADFSVAALGEGKEREFIERAQNGDKAALARVLTLIELHGADGVCTKEIARRLAEDSNAPTQQKIIPVLGITGTGGAGKSSLTDEIVRRFLLDFTDKRLAIISVDPSKRKTGGALLGDRIRMNAIHNERVFMRSLATRQSNAAVSASLSLMIPALKLARFDLIVVETAGIGQSGSEITDIADVSLYVMTPEFGAATQLEKIDMLDFADVVALNKFDKSGALDALRDVRKQYQRAHSRWNDKPEQMPVYGTMASQFNDPGTNALYRALMDALAQKTNAPLHSSFALSDEMSKKIYIIPPHRTRYLAEIAEEHERYNKRVAEQTEIARKLYRIEGALEALREAENS